MSRRVDSVGAKQRPLARPSVYPRLARPGRGDGRSQIGPAMNVTSMPGQIRVAKGFCSFVRKTLGSWARVAEFWSSSAFAGRTRLPCNCCVVPPLDSAPSHEPRLRPGDPASRLMVGSADHSIAGFHVAQHSCCRPNNLPLYGGLMADNRQSICSQSEHGDGAGWSTEFNGVRSVTQRHDLPPASAGRWRLCETTFTQRAFERSGLFDARCDVDSTSFPSFFMDKDTQTSTKPLKTIRFRGISASVFENKSDKGDVFHKVSIVRTYKDGRNFKTTPTFSRDELPIVSLVAQQAFDFILTEELDQRDTGQR